MMNNIENILGILFRRVSSEKILLERIDGSEFSEKEFVLLIRNYLDRYSDTELENMYSYLSNVFLKKYYGADGNEDINRGLNAFSLLRTYASWILTFHNNEIVCEYNKLFHWRTITQSLSEDLVVAAFLANHDQRYMIERERFDWKPFITHNNEELRKIVKSGICENHYHLKGAAPIFQLTWVSMMNNVISDGFIDNLAKIENDKRSSNIKYEKQYTEQSFLVQVMQALLIRFFLVSQLRDMIIKIGDYSELRENDSDLDINEYNRRWKQRTEENVWNLLRNPDDLLLFRGDIQDQIVTSKFEVLEVQYPDYAINVSNNSVFYEYKNLAYEGERWFLYKMFKGIYIKDEQIIKYQDLFYAYLVIKENIRAEFIQINGYVGFENFRIYQDRKEYFLENSFFNNLLIKEAIQSSLLDSNVLSLEIRIAPKNDAEAMAGQIRKLDKIICGEDFKRKKKCFYTVHFIKVGKDRYKGEVPVRSRHHQLRENIKMQAFAIAEMREKYPEEGKRIRGIDAANIEIGCGPEVFAQVFRFLNTHLPTKYLVYDVKMPQLKMTYHVGEDFLDMVSGLRAIDEAIQFLNMGCGSRMGHALALGVDSAEWYNSKNNRIIISQQEYLDNVVWLYHMLEVFQITESNALRDYLMREFDYYFSLIYKGALTKERLCIIRDKALKYYKGSSWEYFYLGNLYDFNIKNYYEAWSLRGDAPELYQNGFYENKHSDLCFGNLFAECAINKRFPLKQEVRYFSEVGVLYYLYHFDENVRIEGAKCIEVKIKKSWIEAVSLVQKEMQNRVAKYGIGIETNPSSNVLIGTFKRYEKHPILKFYNKNLVNDVKLLDECPQLSVSINTDDQGIFNTSLENEYAYMALALEKTKDEKGNLLYKKSMIYQWIDDIRKMGIRQTFLDENELEELMHIN